MAAQSRCSQVTPPSPAILVFPYKNCLLLCALSSFEICLEIFESPCMFTMIFYVQVVKDGYHEKLLSIFKTSPCYNTNFILKFMSLSVALKSDLQSCREFKSKDTTSLFFLPFLFFPHLSLPSLLQRRCGGGRVKEFLN